MTMGTIFAIYCIVAYGFVITTLLLVREELKMIKARHPENYKTGTLEFLLFLLISGAPLTIWLMIYWMMADD